MNSPGRSCFWPRRESVRRAAGRGLALLAELADLAELVALGAVLTVVALFYYLVIAKRMYIDAPERSDRIQVAPPLGLSLLLRALGVVGLGVYPKPLVMAALRVASGLF